MHQEMTFKERLKDFFSWAQFKDMLIVNSIIALVLLIPNYVPDASRMLRWFLMTQLYSQLIGFSISFCITMGAADRIRGRPLFLLATAGLIITGGIIGASIAAFISTQLGYIHPFRRLVDYTEVALLSVVFGSTVYAYFYLRGRLQETAEKLAEKEVIEAKLRQTKTAAELDALRARVNPHFLFNTLNSIAGLIHDKPDLAEEVTWKLADLLRSAMASGDQAKVTLERELELVRAYLLIEKARLGDRLTYEIDCDSKLHPLALPIMLLQPLVENSVQHGIAPKREGGQIRIQCSVDKNRLEIIIEDNGRGWNPATFKEGFGLSGVRDRLALSYGEDYDLEIHNDDGVRLRLMLPCRESL